LDTVGSLACIEKIEKRGTKTGSVITIDTEQKRVAH
jgi:hypothetical protein